MYSNNERRNFHLIIFANWVRLLIFTLFRFIFSSFPVFIAALLKIIYTETFVGEISTKLG